MIGLRVVFLNLFFAIQLNPILAHKNIWAVLLAGYDYYEFTFSFEAAVCKMYSRLIKHGILPEHIITMSPDSAAFHRKNRVPGLLTFGESKMYLTEDDNVYNDVIIDYKTDDLTSDKFYDIMSGNEAALNTTGSGKVLKSGPNDYVFLYIVTLGEFGFLMLNNEEFLWAEEFVPFWENMKEKKRFKKTFITVESSNAGSMFDDFLDPDKSILVHTFGGRYNPLYVCHYNDLLQAFTSTCSTFIHSFYLDQQMKSTNNEFKNIFDLIVDISNEARPPSAVHNLYGQLDMAKSRIGLFIGTPSFQNDSFSSTSKTVTSTRERELLTSAIHKGISIKQLFQEDKRITDAERTKLKRFLADIVSQSTTNLQLSNTFLKEPIHNFPVDKYKCYRKILNTVRFECFTKQTDHILLTEATKLAKLCAMDVPEDNIIAVTKKICKQ